MSSTLGIVNKIIPFSAVDGVGNRAVIFLQGCNFFCQYCHNPETICACNHCGACVSACPTNALIAGFDSAVSFSPKLCISCDLCLKSCKHLSTPKAIAMSAEEVMNEICKARAFIRGITVSGGECTLQTAFLIELFTLAKQNNLSTFIDTNGSVPLWEAKNLMALTDGVMLDVKAFCETEHIWLTGVSNKTMLLNLEFLATTNKLIEVRTVIISEGINYEQTIDEVCKVMRGYTNFEELVYKLIKYRHHGVREPYRTKLKPSDSNYLEELRKRVSKNGVKNVIVV